MNDAKSALYLRAVPCPACGGATSQPTIKSGMYAEEEREADQHVTRYRWLQADVPPVHPPYYVLAHCPRCAFTDFREDFLEPTRSRENRVRLLAPRLKAEAGRPGSAIGMLRQGLQPGPIEFPAALRLHLLAIAIQELLPPDARDHLKIARLYLRTAWLYRERADASRPPAEDQTGLEALDALAARLRDLQAAVERVAVVYSGKPEGPECAALVGQVEEVRKRCGSLRSRLVRAKDNGDPLGFLVAARGEWPDIPISEAHCLDAAVQAFEQAYQQGEGETLGLLKLMVELNYRLGRFDRVLEYAGMISKTGQEERVRLQRRLETERDVPPAERGRLNARINQIGSLLLLAAEIRREALKRQAAAPPPTPPAPATPPR